MHEQFSQQLQAYGHWKAKMVQHIKTYQAWLLDHGLNEAEDDLRIFEVIDALNSDALTIAFVAEFSRGKTELINAIFFADYQRRLLPSAAGRTTMCPTELFYDKVADRSYIRLLPIETRTEETTISQYKQNVMFWTTVDLDTSSPDAMAEAFKEIVRVKHVSVAEAKRLGLYTEEPPAEGQTPPTQIEIPVWRHALISFPHPLLKEGLTVLDTPGLNALGNEPELTMEMIPAAQAVMFILAADTGVTKSDLDMWRHHITPHIKNEESGVLVVLNKIDTMWDELKDAAAVNTSIDSQRDATAKALDLDDEKVFPVSAQKGLLAKVKHDTALLDRSGLARLEIFLAEHVVPSKQAIVRDNVVSKMGARIESTKQLLQGRFDAAQKQLNELRSLSGKNTDVILQLMNKARDAQESYKKHVENFQTSRHVLTQQVKTVLETLSIDNFDKLIAKSRGEMVESWTTGGMKNIMKTFFDTALHTMEQVNWQAGKSNDLVQAVYQRFREEHELGDVKPTLFSTKKYVTQLQRLYKEAEAFRTSPVTTMTEQSFVVKKFFVSLVSHVRNIFFQAKQDAEGWAKSVMNPLASRIKERKQQLDEHLENLKKIKMSREKLEEKIEELQKLSSELNKQITTINALLEAVNSPLPTGMDENLEAQAAVATG
jgi:hypothetical protein